MNREEWLVDLLVRWGESKRQGQPVPLESLCADCPELLPELAERIRNIEAVQPFLSEDGDRDEILSLPQFPTVTSRKDPTRRTSYSFDIESFSRALEESGLISAEQICRLRELYPRDDALSLAHRLVLERRLTAFQANVLLEGRDLPLVLDRYVILNEIGSGGMGTVFKALHKQMDRVVALKVLPRGAVDSSEKIKRFHREVRAAAKLRHTNIALAYDATEAKGVHFLVMEYVDGSDLAQVVRRQGPLAVQDALRYLIQAARGLEHAHSQGVIHRDIKPANLLLDRTGTVKISDMGLALMHSNDAEEPDRTTSQELTHTGVVLGTIAYLAPEQALDTHIADARSDVYSLGCSLHFLLTGFAVYSEGTLMRTLLAHREAEIPSLRQHRPDVSEELDGVFQKMIAKDPKDRFQTMTEVIEALESLVIEDAPPPSSHQAIGDDRPSTDNATAATKTQMEFAETDRSAQFRGRGVIVALSVLFLIGAVWASGFFLEVKTPAGTIVVQSDQPEIAGATVTVDGQNRLTISPQGDGAPITVTADEQTHTLKVVKGGFETFTRQFTIKAGKEQTIHVRLKPLPPPHQEQTASVQASNWALQFDGEDDYVTTPVRYDSGPITVEAFVKPARAGGRSYAVVSSAELLLHHRAHPWRTNRNRPFWRAGGAAGDGSGVLGTTSLRIVQIEQPVHLAAVWDESRLALFVAGRQQYSRELPGGMKRNGYPLYIGATPASFGKGIREFFAGVIDEVRISRCARYDADFLPVRQFEPDELTIALYHFDESEGAILKDASGNGNDGKIVGATWVKEIAPGQFEPYGSNRHAAQWVLAQNGRVAVVDASAVNQAIQEIDRLWETGISGTSWLFRQGQVATHESELPTDPFQILTIDLHNQYKVNSTGGKLYKTVVTDADLKRLAELQGLTALNLAYSSVTDAGLQHLRELKNLRWLDLHFTQVHGTGLSHLGELAELRCLNMGGLRVTGPSLAFLSKLKKLTDLALGSRPTAIADSDLQYVGMVTSLKSLNLRDARISDAGLVYLTTLTNLRRLDLSNTRVSESGVRSLLEQLPNCKIICDYSFPSADDRATVQWVRQLGGTVTTNPSPWDELSSEPFKLTGIDFAKSSQLQDNHLERLAGLKNLRTLSLANTQVTDASLAHLQNLTRLETLNLHGTNVTGTGLPYLTKLDKLRELRLGGTRLGRQGFEQLKKLTTVRSLELSETQIEDSDLAHISELSDLNELILRHCNKLTDSGLVHIGKLEHLTGLTIEWGNLRGDGLEHLQNLDNLQRLLLEGCPITDDGMAHLGKLKTLTDLRLGSPHITGKSLEHIKGLTKMKYLVLSTAKISDDDLVHLTGLTNLTGLLLAKTQLTDRAFEHLRVFTNLREMNLTGTAISPAGLQALKDALPGCKILSE